MFLFKLMLYTFCDEINGNIIVLFCFVNCTVLKICSECVSSMNMGAGLSEIIVK